LDSLWGITLIILGILAAPSLILSRKPDADKILGKITPYQGWIGIIFCLWGIYGIIWSVMNIDLIAWFPVWWFTLLIGCVMEMILGFILGYGLIAKYIFSKSEEAQAKGAAIIAKLAPVQGTLGLIGIIVGIWVIVAFFLFYPRF
jgi:hypothetical protein